MPQKIQRIERDPIIPLAVKMRRVVNDLVDRENARPQEPIIRFSEKAEEKSVILDIKWDATNGKLLAKRSIPKDGETVDSSGYFTVYQAVAYWQPES